MKDVDKINLLLKEWVRYVIYEKQVDDATQQRYEGMVIALSSHATSRDEAKTKKHTIPSPQTLKGTQIDCKNSEN